MAYKLFIRGLILPGGIDDIARKLDAAYTSWFLSYFRWRFSEPPSQPLHIVGHSLGANAACRMANRLGRRGIKIGAVIMLDPTMTLRCSHGEYRIAYQSSDFRAKEIRGASNISRPDLDHMSMTHDGEIFRRIKQELADE